MIAGIFHKGSGLGNQLFRYVFVRSLAKDKGFDFGMQNIENFKGASFLNLNMGQTVQEMKHTYTEPKTVYTDNITDIRGYDFDGVSKIEDHTLIDGEFQGEKYFLQHKDEIREWLKIEPLDLPNDLCIINFRGGEYVGGQNLFLAPQYWKNAMTNMRKLNPNIKFRVVTDDVKTAKKFFSHIEISHEMANDYASIQYAKYLILSNSSFALMPAWLNQNAKMIIAPKYWGRHNVSDGYWSCEYNMVEGWMYQDRNGELSDYRSCQKGLVEYKNGAFRDISSVYLPPLPIQYKIAKLLPKNIRAFLRKVYGN